ERDEKVVHKTRMPMFTFNVEAFTFASVDLHLWKKETAAPEFVMLVTHVGTAAVQPPIPESEDENMRQPSCRARQQKLERRLCVRWQGRDQKGDRPHQ